MFPMAEVGSAGSGEVESHGLVGTFSGFEGSACRPQNIVPQLGIVSASESKRLLRFVGSAGSLGVVVVHKACHSEF